LKPLLVDNKKFDLRLYLVLKGVDAVDVYLCQEGMARFCTKEYCKPTAKNCDDLFMHLTNSSINKTSKHYKLNQNISEQRQHKSFLSENDHSSKRLLSSLYKHLAKIHGNEKVLEL